MKWLAPVVALLAVGLGAVAPWLMWGEPKKADPDLVARVPWAALLALLISLVSSRGEGNASRGMWGAGAGVLCSLAAMGAVGLAVGAERINYWDAFHFASLFWAGALSAVVAVTGTARARASSSVAAAVFPVAVLVLSAYVLVWSWMTFPFVQEIEGAVARWAYLITHG